ncbi:hypothetical protein, partial [Maribacter sp.]|uniref:hypothetical protein n=1 Tax=Maribacter sp. TaxID=1897614 RepID=UPI003298DA50
TNEATPQPITGDATIDNAGILTISADAIENTMIAANVAGNGLVQNATSGALDIIPGTTNNQILKWNDVTSTWDLGTDNGNVPNAIAGTILFSDGSNAIEVDETELFWDNTLNRLGIGTNNPRNKLEVTGEVRSQGYSNSNGTPGEPSYSFTNDTDTGMFRGVAGGGNAPVNWLRLATGGTEAITINPSQFVGIGPDFATGTTIDSRLHVDGDIRAEGAITASGTLTTVPDYVFQKYFLGSSILNADYEFQSLAKVEAFVKENNHLPGIKSAAAIKEQGFWDLGEASRVNLEKIEELFLHTIEQEKKIKELQSANTNMSTELEALKAQMAEIKTMLLEKQNN